MLQDLSNGGTGLWLLPHVVPTHAFCEPNRALRQLRSINARELVASKTWFMENALKLRSSQRQKTLPVVLLLAVLCSGIGLSGCQRQSQNTEALHRAVLANDLVKVKGILERDPRAVNARDRNGYTALHLTVARQQISRNAVEIPIGKNRSPSEIACMPIPALMSYDFDDIRRYGPQKLINNSETTAEDHAPMAELLIRYGADVNARDDRFYHRPLHLAAKMGHLSVAKTLLAHGADIEAGDREGLTALHVAATAGNLAMARLLLDRGADPNASAKGSFLFTFSQDDTPLSSAIVCGHRDMADLLLRRGADPNRILHDHFTALHWAETADIAELLLAHGAKLEMRGYENRTPLHQAAMRNRIEVVKYFLDRGANTEARDEHGLTPLLLALDQRTSSIGVIALLVQHGAKVNVRSSAGTPAIHSAVGRSVEIVRLLLDAGADINTPDRLQRTPLHIAVISKDLTMVKYLLSRGADPNRQDYARRTPLYYTWGGSEDDREIAAVLREHGGR